MKFIKIFKYHFSISILIFFFLTKSTLSLSKIIKNPIELKRNPLNEKQQNFLKIAEKLKNSLIKNGAEFKNFGLKFLNENNRFIIAEEDIPKNTIIIKIPFKNLIHYRNPKIKAFCKSFKTQKPLNLQRKNQFNCLVIFTLFQMKNPDPEFKDYIESIPNSFQEYPIFFTANEKKIFKNSFLDQSISSLESSIDNLRKFIDNNDLKKKFTKIDVIKAYLAVQSRNFGIKLEEDENFDYHVMAPYTDLFNYSPDVNTYWNDSIRNYDGFFELKATKDIKKGQQIYVDYGNHDNEKLLIDYGFTLKNNPNPLIGEYFVFLKNGKKHETKLCSNSSDCLIQISKKFQMNNKGKDEMRLNEIKFYEEFIQQLKKYSNKQRLENIKNKLNESSNMVNIYRALLTEDLLIDRNIEYANEIIQVLKGGKDLLSKKHTKHWIKNTKKYFENFF